MQELEKLAYMQDTQTRFEIAIFPFQEWSFTFAKIVLLDSIPAPACNAVRLALNFTTRTPKFEFLPSYKQFNPFAVIQAKQISRVGARINGGEMTEKDVH